MVSVRAVGAAALLLLSSSCAPSVPPSLPPIVTPAASTGVAPTPTEPVAAPAVPTPGPARPRVDADTRATPAPTVPPAPRPHQSLQPAIDSVVAQQPGTLGVLVEDLASGDTASLRADRQFPSASLYKLFVMQTAAQLVRGGTLSLTETLTLSPELVASDPYADLPVGTQTSVDCALQTMLEASSNSAADLLIDRLGLDTINAHMAALGLSQSSITDQTAFTSPADVARLLEHLARSAGTGDTTSAHLLDMLAHQQHSDRLPVPLPLGVRIAHKTGELPGLRHDAGIVYAPGGAYVFVAMVQDAPSEAAARATIVDLSRAVYTALEPGGLRLYHGLPPRLAREVFDVPDAQGRIELLVDARTETVPVSSAASGGADALRVRAEALPDLLALQAEAARAGVPVSVLDALRSPTDRQASQAQPMVLVAPCAMDIPSPGDGPRYGQTPTPDRPGGLKQQWLGTVVVLGDEHGDAFAGPESDSPAGQWLLAHAWEHGFMLAPPETDAGRARGHEPWTLRWVGQTMAAELHAQGAEGPAALEVLRRARLELSAQAGDDVRAALRSGPDSQGLPCWAVPDTTTQGCPARWFFSPSASP